MITIPYKNREKSFITLKLIKQPYGKESDPVISLGCTLKSDVENPTWKVHIPLNILNDVIIALKDFNHE
jgi:hypothetical protein